MITFDDIKANGGTITEPQIIVDSYLKILAVIIGFLIAILSLWRLFKKP